MSTRCFFGFHDFGADGRCRRRRCDERRSADRVRYNPPPQEPPERPVSGVSTNRVTPGPVPAPPLLDRGVLLVNDVRVENHPLPIISLPERDLRNLVEMVGLILPTAFDLGPGRSGYEMNLASNQLRCSKALDKVCKHLARKKRDGPAGKAERLDEGVDLGQDGSACAPCCEADFQRDVRADDLERVWEICPLLKQAQGEPEEKAKPPGPPIPSDRVVPAQPTANPDVIRKGGMAEKPPGHTSEGPERGAVGGGAADLSSPER